MSIVKEESFDDVIAGIHMGLNYKDCIKTGHNLVPEMDIVEVHGVDGVDGFEVETTGKYYCSHCRITKPQN